MNSSSDNLRPTERFSNRAGHYARYRPSYPADLIPLLSREAGLTPRSAVADVGSGTGLLTEILVRNQNPIYAVEPNAQMRGAAEQSLAPFPSFHSVNGTAEATTLRDQSVDSVTVAQAFHWFDGPVAVAEFRRILKPGGFVALIWNARDTAASPFMAEYERIVHTHGSNFARSGKELVPPERLRVLLGPAMRTHVLRNYQELNWEGLKGRLLSASYMPLEGQPGYEPMMTELRRVYNAHAAGGQVRIEYECRVYLATL